MILFVFPAFAGLLDTLTPDERQVAICRQAAEPAQEAHDYTRAAGVWEACLAESKRTGQAGAAVMLQDQLALTQARAAASEWRTADPDRYAQAVLSVVADQRSSYYLGNDVTEIFRAWMTTEAGKGRLDPVRTITLIWEDGAGKTDTGRRAAEVFRRHVEDLGLRWADPGKPEVDVIVYATLTLGALDPVSTGPAGVLPRAEARFEASRVRFRTIDDETDGFRTTGAAEEATREEAENAALRDACERAAQRLLKQVLQHVFR